MNLYFFSLISFIRFHYVYRYIYCYITLYILFYALFLPLSFSSSLSNQISRSLEFRISLVHCYCYSTYYIRDSCVRRTAATPIKPRLLWQISRFNSFNGYVVSSIYKFRKKIIYFDQRREKIILIDDLHVVLCDLCSKRLVWFVFKETCMICVRNKLCSLCKENILFERARSIIRLVSVWLI